MANVYKDFRDDVAAGAVNDAIDRLKNPDGIKQHGYSDRSKPALVPPLLPASKINPTREWPKKLHIPLPD